jgi:hypothetical protein
MEYTFPNVVVLVSKLWEPALFRWVKEVSLLNVQ